MPFVGVSAAMAATGTANATLRPVALNGVKGSGTAMAAVQGNTLSVTMAASGLLKNQPHAAHIHFGANARNECPVARTTPRATGASTRTDGGPAYGEIVVSLTKTGDTSPKSGLAVDRFDTASGGTISYERGSITISDAVASAITGGKAVVVHGVDYNTSGKYDGSTKSDLDHSLPTEATDPALCGEYPKDAFPTAKVYGPTTRAELRLITCGGTFDRSIGHYRDNIVAYAHLVA